MPLTRAKADAPSACSSSFSQTIIRIRFRRLAFLGTLFVTDLAINVIRADADRQQEALRILLSQFPADEQEARLADTLLAVERGALNLSSLWVAEQDQVPQGAALVMAQADGVSLVWLPVTAGAADESVVRPAMMDALCRELDASQARFGQVLLSAEESAKCPWLADYGFEIAAELFFLARSLEEPLPKNPALAERDFDLFDEHRNFDRYARVIEQSYLNSLDCPRLNGSRTGAEAIAGHRLSGAFDPRGWKLYQQAGRDAAVLLLNEHPDQDAVELVYFGVVPEFRGQNWGERILADAIQTSQSWRRAVIFLAVDAGNSYANRIYAEFGFQEVARRVVWLRFPGGTARK